VQLTDATCEVVRHATHRACDSEAPQAPNDNIAFPTICFACDIYMLFV
jgi:hypothetical protein